MSKASPEFFVSIDIETDGPIPGPHSMLSLGAAAFAADGEFLDRLSINFEPLPGAAAHPETAKFWADNPEALAETRIDTVEPTSGIGRFADWVDGLAARHAAKPVAVAFPAGFDFMFVYWYLVRFRGRSPFGFSCLDGKTLAHAATGLGYRAAGKRSYPAHWTAGLPPHSHVAVEDAIEQGIVLGRIRTDLQRLRDAGRPSG